MASAREERSMHGSARRRTDAHSSSRGIAQRLLGGHRPLEAETRRFLGASDPSEEVFDERSPACDSSPASDDTGSEEGRVPELESARSNLPSAARAPSQSPAHASKLSSARGLLDARSTPRGTPRFCLAELAGRLV